MLRHTLDQLGALQGIAGEMEVIVIDNASASPVRLPSELANGARVKGIYLKRNISAAARNVGALEAQGQWLVMLDDDSHVLDGPGLVSAISGASADTLAVQAEIFLPPAPMPRRGQGGDSTSLIRRESGGLPEVVIGCGAAIRRDAFVRLGGYDPTFDYYAEEYDLCARLLLMGGRVTIDRRFGVLHRKVQTNRRFGRIIRRLVRNNGWVAERYAPDNVREQEVRELISRYWRIARKERAVLGYARGLAELLSTRKHQPRQTMPSELWDRFTGLSQARSTLAAAHAREALGSVAIVEPGKNAWCVEQALRELGCKFAGNVHSADTLVVGSMSPGPMLDAAAKAAREHEAVRVLSPWDMGDAVQHVALVASGAEAA